jgi:hypothetical protein
MALALLGCKGLEAGEDQYLHTEDCQIGKCIQVLKFSNFVFSQKQTLQVG